MAEEIGKSFARRDRLLEIESQVRKWWSDDDVFRSDPDESPPNRVKSSSAPLPLPLHERQSPRGPRVLPLQAGIRRGLPPPERGQRAAALRLPRHRDADQSLRR
ncbi:hypothetical protein ACP275_06G193100 [Erythranthe tilingii]